MSIITNAMNDVSLFSRIKERLISNRFGRAGIGLGLKVGATFSEEFTDSVLAECQQAVKKAEETGVPLSPAYRMAMHVLLDSAMLDRSREPEQMPRRA